MLIDLKEIPAYYINLSQHTEKRDRIEIMLNELGFKKIIRIEGCNYPENPVAGCSRAHYRALTNYHSERGFPFILFEDDVVLNKDQWSNGLIAVPDQADAVYLGTSTWGRMNGHNGEYVQYDILKDFPRILRIYNMLATHAILYLNAEYVNLIRRVAYYTGYIIENYNDVAFAELQRYFKIYSLDTPLFFQTSNLNATNKSITSVDHTECMAINNLQFYPYRLK